MKKFVLAAIAVMTLVVVTPTQANAAGKRGARVANGNRRGVFSRLMDLERRKNQALLRMIGM